MENQFGPIILTGSSAQAFTKQFLESVAKPNPLAQASLGRGKLMRKEYEENGYIVAANHLVVRSS